MESVQLVDVLNSVHNGRETWFLEQWAANLPVQLM
jgi:hypothetical protein